MKLYIVALAILSVAGAPNRGLATGSVTPELKGGAFRDCPQCPEIIKIPGVGQTTTLKRPLYVGKFELTWHEYLISVREAGCPMPEYDTNEHYSFSPSLDDNYPVTFVRLSAFKCYLGWINRATGKRYRLPTPVEWEHAARAGADTVYPWGNDLGQGHAIVLGHYNLDELRGYLRPSDPRSEIKYGGLFPVGLMPPNAWGLFDVIGNAAETVDAIKPATFCPKIVERASCFAIMQRGTRFSDRQKDLMTVYSYNPDFGGIGRGYRLIRD